MAAAVLGWAQTSTRTSERYRVLTAPSILQGLAVPGVDERRPSSSSCISLVVRCSYLSAWFSPSGSPNLDNIDRHLRRKDSQEYPHNESLWDIASS